MQGNTKQHVAAASLNRGTGIPDGRLVYDWVFDAARCKWLPWLDTVDVRAPDPEAEYTSIVVQTADTVRYTCVTPATCGTLYGHILPAASSLHYVHNT